MKITNEERGKALEMFKAGASKNQVAKALFGGYWEKVKAVHADLLANGELDAVRCATKEGGRCEETEEVSET